MFAVDYQGAVNDAQACARHTDAGFDGLIKDAPPTAAYRVQCRP